METLNLLVEKAAHIANEFFENERGNETELPYLWSFPTNCCEVTAAFLGLAFEQTLPGRHVWVAKAYNRNTNNWHFWVEVEDFVVDITAHQFPAYSEILVCPRPSPLESDFPDVERVRSAVVLAGLKSISSSQANSLLDRLQAQMPVQA